MDDFFKYDYLPITLKDMAANIFLMPVKDLIFISYTAVRGRDNESGAVQRMLSPVRLRSIEEYILNGNTFYTPFYINWTNNEKGATTNDGKIEIPKIMESAQILDGQHRLEGFKKAIARKSDYENNKVIVVMTSNLNTKSAASIFLNINTEQRPVPKSLIYDLFGLINEDLDNLPLVRARDIAEALNTEDTSPYKNTVKMPGTPRGIGVVDLSTMVNAIRPLLEEAGTFRRFNIENLNNQTNVIINYLNSIKSVYSKSNHWYSKSSNPFFTNAGFTAAILVLGSTVIEKCATIKSFKSETISAILKLENTALLLRSDIKNQDGKTQRKNIEKFLIDSINRDIPEEDEYDF